MKEITKLLKKQQNNIINILIALAPYLVSYFAQEQEGFQEVIDRKFTNYGCRCDVGEVYVARAVQLTGIYASILVFIWLKIKEAFNVDHNLKAIAEFFFHAVGQFLIFLLILTCTYYALKNVTF